MFNTSLGFFVLGFSAKYTVVLNTREVSVNGFQYFVKLQHSKVILDFAIYVVKAANLLNANSKTV